MKRLKRWLRGPSAVLVLYAAVALNPSLLFAHELRVENLTLHSREPLPPEARAILQATHDRVAKSPYFDAHDSYDLYLCDTPALFTFFVPWARNVGAISLIGATGNVFVRPANVANDRLIGPHGKEVPGVRTLTYYFAHEVTHTAMARKLGRLEYFGRPSWELEGYADFIGKAGAFDFDAERARYRNGDVELDPAKSGLYLRHQLFVEALLREGVSLDDLHHADIEALERRLRQ